MQRFPMQKNFLRRLALMVIAGLAGVVGCACVAQTHSSGDLGESKQPQFEVASVKRTPPEQHILNALFTYPGGRVVAKGATLEFLLMEAFSVERFQIVGGPAWIRETRFDIEAKPPESIARKYNDVPVAKNPPSDEQRKMLQSLLIERFHLASHFMEGSGFVYVLKTSGRPLGLHAAKNPNEFHYAGQPGGGLPAGNGLEGIDISMAELAARISSWLSRPVHDRTGLTGSYDFEVTTGDEDAASQADVESNILTSLKSIGLELKKGTGPVRELVVDRVSALSEN